MKKLILLIPLCFCTLLISAQEETRAFRFGLKAAPNLSWMKPDSDLLVSSNPALKFNYGLIAEFALAENYFFATGVEIQTMGGNLNFSDSVYYISGSGTGQTVFFLKERNYKLQYLDIPLTIKMRTNEIGYMRYFGQFGLNTSFRTKAKADDKGRFLSGGDVTKTNIDIAGDVQIIRLALNLGIGVEYSLVGNTAVLVALNYSNGFTNALTKKSKQLNYLNEKINQKATTNYIALTVGVIF